MTYLADQPGFAGKTVLGKETVLVNGPGPGLVRGPGLVALAVAGRRWVTR